jgi:DNA repair protein RadC
MAGGLAEEPDERRLLGFGMPSEQALEAKPLATSARNLESQRQAYGLEELMALPLDQPNGGQQTGDDTIEVDGGLHAENHRERMRARFEKFGAALDDYELLELFLFRTMARRDTRPIARAALKRFGSLSALAAQPVHLLKEIPGIGDASAHDIRLFGAMMQHATRADIPASASLLGSWDKLLAYCRATLAHEAREQFRILFLNKKNALIADEVQQVGTVDHTPVYPREVIRRALELSASAIILVHNHPSGDPTPSAADVEMTHRIKATAEALDIRVHDHLIFGRNGYVSLRSENLM